MRLIQESMLLPACHAKPKRKISQKSQIFEIKSSSPSGVILIQILKPIPFLSMPVSFICM